MPGSVDSEELKRFNKIGNQWWDTKGPARVLQAMNRVRTRWIETEIQAAGLQTPETVSLLDIGCGGGLASEALASSGYSVLGVDASETAIKAANAHKELTGSPAVYRQAVLEDLLTEEQKFDVICALELLEHIEDPESFIQNLSSLLNPGGIFFASTVNRTVRSGLIAKIGAEYITKLVPPGTHSWQRFIKPGELTDMLHKSGLRVINATGLVYNLPSGQWRTAKDLSMNYILSAKAG